MAFQVTYNGNGSNGGSVPVDKNLYNAGDTVVIQPTGSLTKTGATFAYWNTKADGSGALHGWPQDGSFTMPAANVTLYAQWFISTGLQNGGATTHYRFSYDSALAAGGLEPGRTQALMNAAEGDYNIMAGWFPGVTPSGAAQRNVYVTAMTGGAKNTGDIRLFPNTQDPRELRCYLVSEITESFMHGQGKGWGFLPGLTNEESCGEGLSLFLTQQFAVQMGFASPYTNFTANTGDGWLNSSLPSTNPASTRYLKNADGSVTDFGARFDYVNSLLPYPGNGPGTGCSILFLYYLFHQFGFGINQIIDSAPGYDSNGKLKSTAPLRGVYQNLTGDNGDPFPDFKQLLDAAYPPDQVSSIGGANPDDPWPLAPFPAMRQLIPGDNGVLYALMDNGDLHWYRNDGYGDGTPRWAFGTPRRVGKGWSAKQVFSGGGGVLYAIQENGDLLWYKHTGANDGTFNWAPGSGNKVGVGWDFRIAFGAGGGIIYGVKDNGDLLWYRHDGYTDGSFKWAANSGAKVGNGWSGKQVFTVGNGVIYTYGGNGDLLWYKHLGWQDGSFNWVSNSGAKVGNGWDAWQVASFGNGYIYAANLNGDLHWYQHTGWPNGSDSWAAASGAKVGNGWNFCPIVYSVPASGNLMWYRHDGWGTGTFEWTNGNGKQVGNGWENARMVFPGGHGVIYAIQQNGDLLWYRHDGMGDATGRWTSADGAKVGNGWENARLVFPGGDGVIYAVQQNGDLLWYRHDGWGDGSVVWTSGGGAKVGNGWENVRLAFSGGNGVIYAIQQNGDLMWYRHDGWGDGSGVWTSAGGTKVGNGWAATHVFPGSNGVIYAVQSNGDLLWYRHDGWGDGTIRWTAGNGNKVGSGWSVEQVFAM